MFGEKIREMRLKQGLSLRQLASKSNVSFTTIYRWENENSKIALDTAEKILNALGLKLEITTNQSDR